MLENGSTVVGEGKGTLPLGARCKDQEVVVNAFVRGQYDGAVAALFTLLNGGDAANLDGAIVLNKKAFVRDENRVFEFALGGGGHADGGREMKGEGTGGYEGEGSGIRIDLGGEDASDGRASCATTNDYDALAAGLGHGMDRRSSGE